MRSALHRCAVVVSAVAALSLSAGTAAADRHLLDIGNTDPNGFLQSAH